ncbi:unnamed protein product [Chondrus crispus]|uniref:Uncharacterized protein n=1 Tax=Chondrus crispus TaxID=2769 RepID=R7QPI4_CHOCR|nr:unnamed protein product [Chondrus crispus]CDF39979.1 unnamed protein product [Chondrus crispus]|eukprot:XP_005710273.1 unnamed protein product [Chondrus crispus]
MSSLFATEKLTKLVSMRTRKGGPREGLNWKNMEAGLGLRASLALSDSLLTMGAAAALESAFICNRESVGETRRLTSANLRVRLARPIVARQASRLEG